MTRQLSPSDNISINQPYKTDTSNDKTDTSNDINMMITPKVESFD